MNEIFKREVLARILAYMAEQYIGPQQKVPVKTVWINLKHPNFDELREAIIWAVKELGFLTFTPGGPGGTGYIALTDSGYEESRRS